MRSAVKLTFSRPGWPGSYAMSHSEAEAMLNYSSKSSFQEKNPLGNLNL